MKIKIITTVILCLTAILSHAQDKFVDQSLFKIIKNQTEFNNLGFNIPLVNDSPEMSFSGKDTKFVFILSNNRTCHYLYPKLEAIAVMYPQIKYYVIDWNFFSDSEKMRKITKTYPFIMIGNKKAITGDVLPYNASLDEIENMIIIHTLNIAEATAQQRMSAADKLMSDAPGSEYWYGTVAASIYEQLLEKSPNSLQLLIKLAKAYQKGLKPTKAYDYALEALKLDPQNKEMLEIKDNKPIYLE